MALGDLRRTIGPYEVQEVIGYGGMSTVYRALQHELDRTVAIKMLLPAYLNDASFRARFQSEARLIARLRHPNIVGIYDVSEDDGQPYLVMEYLEGITLHAAIVQRRQQELVFSPAEALDLLRPLANALDYAHSRNVVHRDLKPENIILTAHGPVLTDFGLAKLLQEESATVSIVMGTPAYMAPEQIESQPIDARTDVYAMGVMLYELLTGHVPYEGTSAVAVAQAHLSEPIPSLASLAPDLELTPQIDAICQRAIAKDKDDRWPSAGALIRALDDAIGAGQTQPADRPTVLSPIRPSGAAPRRVVAPVPRQQRPARNKPRPGVLVLLILLLALVVGGLWGGRYLATRSAPGTGADEARTAAIVAAEPPAITNEPALALGTMVTAEPTGEPTPTPLETSTPDGSVRGVVQAPTGANLRSGPGTAYPVIGGLPDQAMVTVLQQAEGWLNVAAETGARGWIATTLVDVRSGDIASLPRGEIPPPPATQAPTEQPAPTQAPASTAPSTSIAPGEAVRLEDTAFVGGFRNRGASVYGGRTATWVYGQGSGYSSMSATFRLDQAPSGVARLTIEGMDSEDAARTPLQVTVNGVGLFEGASPFPNDDLPLESGRWDALTLDLDPSILAAGSNTIIITNLGRGGVGLPPFVAVDYAIITLP